MKNLFVTLFLFTSFTALNAQKVETGFAQTINSFNSILNTGIYDSEQTQINYPYEIQQWPWKYLFVMRHNDPNLNYQFQISTTFEHDDRVFFRKLAHLKTDTEYNNNWQEFATRGVNTFNGVQTINADQYVNGNIHVNKYIFIPTNKELILGDASNHKRSFRISYNGDDSTGSSNINYSGNLQFRNSNTNPIAIFSNNGNVGIGVNNPENKLDVNGTIRAKEINVESNWADFVFKKDYKLPTLGEVKKHIEDKGTLPGVPSESDVKTKGVNLGEVNAILLQKIEELTLYVIKLQDEVNELKKLK